MVQASVLQGEERAARWGVAGGAKSTSWMSLHIVTLHVMIHTPPSSTPDPRRLPSIPGVPFSSLTPEPAVPVLLA